MKRSFFGALLLAIVSTCAHGAQGADITNSVTILLEQKSPLGSIDAGHEFSGMFANYLSAMQKGLGPLAHFEPESGTRAVHRVAKEPGTCIFPMTRTPERAEFYQWVGQVAEKSYYLYVRSEDAEKLGQLAAFLGTERRVGVVANEASDSLTKTIPGLRRELVTGSDMNFKKLIAGRIDGLVSNSATAEVLIKGIPDAPIIRTELVAKLGLSLACNLLTPRATIERLNQIHKSAAQAYLDVK